MIQVLLRVELLLPHEHLPVGQTELTEEKVVSLAEVALERAEGAAGGKKGWGTITPCCSEVE